MSGLIGTLHVARTAIMAQQTAVRVVSQNIANAETDGYTRQRVDLVSNASIATPFGQLGSGVRVDNVSRLRDPLLDANFRRDSGRAASADLRLELLDQVEQVLTEPSETGLANAFDSFHASWSNLASQPASGPMRTLVLQRGEQLASMMRSYSTRLDETADYAHSRIAVTVGDVNRLAGQIAMINVDVVRVESGGQTASDLRDQRDLLIDQMAKLGSVRVIERGTGDVAVVLDGAMVVDGATHTDLTATTGSPTGIQIGSRNVAFGEGSTLGGLLEVVNTHIPAVQDRLDELAVGVVAQVNALHSAGFTAAGATNVNFFDPAGTTARNIAVTATVGEVVASDAAGESSNNRIALAMAGLRERPAENTIAAGYAGWAAVQNNLGGASFAEHYSATVVDLAAQINDADNAAVVHGALATQAGMRRSSVSGVSTDEELILIMEHQRAYAAAARVVNVVDEMLQTILALGR